MTTPAQVPAPAPAPAPAKPGPAAATAAAALARALCALAGSIDRRVNGDVGAVINVAATHGADPTDLKIIEAYAIAELGLQ